MNQQSYRVLSRTWAAVIGALLLVVAAVTVWFVIQKMRASTDVASFLVCGAAIGTNSRTPCCGR